jgi:hypothetical protein
LLFISCLIFDQIDPKLILIQPKPKDEEAIELNDKKKRKGDDEDEKEAGVEQNKSKKKEQSVLQAKLTKLAIQIGYGGMTIAICTVIVLIVRFCIKEYGQDKKPLTPAIFNPLIKFLITGSSLYKNKILQVSLKEFSH